MECVYLLQEIDFDGTPTGLYKIGKTTKDAEQRKRQYQAGNARRVDVYFTIEVYDSQAVETSLHQRLSAYRLAFGGGDEWFDFRGVNIASVVRVMEEYEPVVSKPEPPPIFAYARESTFSNIHPAIPVALVMGAVFVVVGMFNSFSTYGKLQNHYRQAYIPLKTYAHRSGTGQYNSAAINFKRFANDANDECLKGYGANMARAVLEADKVLRQTKNHSQAWHTFKEEQNAAWLIAEPCRDEIKQFDEGNAK